MKLSQFLTRLKLDLPNIGEKGVSDANFTDFLNEACDQVNLVCKAYKGFTNFNVEASRQIYSLAANVPSFLGKDKRGLFFLDSNSKWKDLIPKTEAWLSEKYPDYLNASSVPVPQWYWIDGDDLGLYPPASTALASGARLYHLKKATPMTLDTHYPFSGSTTELTALKPLDEAILAYVSWKVRPSFGAVTDIDLGERRFLTACRKGAMQIRRSPHLSHDSANRITT